MWVDGAWMMWARGTFSCAYWLFACGLAWRKVGGRGVGRLVSVEDAWTPSHRFAGLQVVGNLGVPVASALES